MVKLKWQNLLVKCLDKIFDAGLCQNYCLLHPHDLYAVVISSFQLFRIYWESTDVGFD